MIKLNQNQYIELNKKYDEHYKKYDYQSYELAKDVYLFGAASRQDEIDELNGCVEGWKSEYNSMCKRFELSQEINKELQKRIDDALNMLDSLQEQHWEKWKEGADMMDQGASNAYEHSYWILKGQNNG